MLYWEEQLPTGDGPVQGEQSLNQGSFYSQQGWWYSLYSYYKLASITRHMIYVNSKMGQQ